MNNTKRLRAFTLIELLIVVAIIAILAAIAVPNFLEAQVRSKVARVKNDMRTQATALESYVIDYNTLTRDSDSDLDRETALASLQYWEKANGATQLTTPIAYMTALLEDPFSKGQSSSASYGSAVGYRIGSGMWAYGNDGVADSQNSFSVMQTNGSQLAYVILSPGPTAKRQRMGYKCFPYRSTNSNETGCYLPYDPTNGSTSPGDIYRFGGNFMGGNWDYIEVNRGHGGAAAAN